MIEPTSERQRRLGEYLAARRAAVDPAKAGLRVAGPRRVVGLRREEVAVLAGVSVDYYTRLEQGRELHPSPAVLDGLCRALGLRADARPYLYRLAGAPEPPPDVALSCGVSPELAAFVHNLREPALVLDAALDVLARNTLGEALHGGFTIADNIARATRRVRENERSEALPSSRRRRVDVRVSIVRRARRAGPTTRRLPQRSRRR